MAHGAPAPNRYTSERFFALVDEGLLHPDDRVELLEGVIVAVAPQNPRHAGSTSCADYALRAAIGTRATIRVQAPLVLGRFSVPEPDLTVVSGHPSEYLKAHPTTALLVIEVAESSLPQDRITKASIYAAAAIPEYWIVDLLHDRVLVYRSPDREAARYRGGRIAAREDRLELVGLPGATVLVGDLLPPVD
jgi:Uma2 family endonuclease